MTTHANRVPPEGLNDAIIEAVKTEPRTSVELAQFLSYAVATIRARTLILAGSGEIYQITRKAPHGSGREFVWHASSGPTLDQEAAVDDERAIPGAQPKRFFTKSYPKIGRRDPLVAALFGLGAAVSAMASRIPTSLLEMER